VPPTDDCSRDELLALIAGQHQTITSQDQTISLLQERVADLERRLGRNSGNSSLPPSTDDRPGVNRAARRGAKPTGRRRGKQPGAPGSGLGFVADPDVRVDHFPDGTCPCGTPLAGATDGGVIGSHQVHDVPPVTVTVTQHDRHQVRCRCGRVHKASRPPLVLAAASSYGPNIQALVCYLLVFQHLPVHRAAALIADLTGAKPSAGYVHSMLARGAAALTEVTTTIRAQIIASPVVGFDETTLRVGPAGTKKHVLSANTDLLTAFWLGGRDLATFHAFGILDAFTGVAVHDRYTVYDHPDFGHLAGHQLCAAHLIRDLADAAESWPDQHWPAQADRALRALISSWHQALAAGDHAVTGPAAAAQRALLAQAVIVGLSQIPRNHRRGAKQLPARNLLECLRDREADVLRFLSDTRVPPTNNISERGLRPEKTQQKISGRLTSEATTRHRLTLRSYLSTAAKHNINMMSALRDAITGNPWTPPTAAFI